MERRTLRYSISLIVCLCVALTLNAQVSSTNGTDKRPVAHKQKKKKDKDVPVYPLFNGVDLSVDLWGPGSYLLGSDNLSMEVAADVNLKNRFFPTLEVGYGKSDTWSEDGIHYKAGAPYLRVGMDYNTFYKKKFQHKLLVGLRYAVSSFSYDVQSLSVDDPIYGGGLGNPNITDGIWGGNLPPFDHTGMKGTMHWIEVCAGIRAHVWKGLYMGWALRYKFRLSATTGEYGDPSYVPGYGTYGSNTLGVSYTITYKLPL